MSAVNIEVIGVNIEVIGVNTEIIGVNTNRKMQKKYRHKGGKGFKSPYEITHMRVPEPLKIQFQKAKEKYDEFIENGGDPNNPPDFFTSYEKLKDTLYWLNELEKFVNGNSLQCTRNICPNWSHTIRIIGDIKAQIVKR